MAAHNSPAVSRMMLPRLPPELRGLVYAQTVDENNHTTSVGLDFASKVYDSSHTRVEITPVHRGNPALLALQRYGFMEGVEYRDFILKNAVQIRIQVYFKGHTNTFIQEHWDKRMATHLKNLFKRYPWLRKVTDYDVRITWAPASWVQGKRRKRIGAIAKRMVEVLTQEMDVVLKARRGTVKTDLRVKDHVVVDHITKHLALGLGEFIWKIDAGTRRQIREVGIALNHAKGGQPAETGTETYLPSKFRAIPKYTSTKTLDGWDEQTGNYVSAVRRELQPGQEEIRRVDMGTHKDVGQRAVAEEILAFGRL